MVDVLSALKKLFFFFFFNLLLSTVRCCGSKAFFGGGFHTGTQGCMVYEEELLFCLSKCVCIAVGLLLNQIEIFPTSKWVLAYTLEQNELHLLHVQMKKWHWQFKMIFHVENFCKDDVCAKKKAFCPGSGFKVPLTGLCGCSWCSGIRMQPCCDRCPLTEQETQKSHTASSCWSN